MCGQTWGLVYRWWVCFRGEGAASWLRPGPQPSPPVPRVALEWWQWLSRGGQGSSDALTSLGPSLRPLDLEFMKHLSKVVNIIPVIAKADTMTLEEKSEFKQRVRRPPPSFPLPIPPSPPPVQAISYPPLLYPSPSPPFPLSSCLTVKEAGLVVSGDHEEGKLVQPQAAFFPPSALTCEDH